MERQARNKETGETYQVSFVVTNFETNEKSIVFVKDFGLELLDRGCHYGEPTWVMEIEEFWKQFEWVRKCQTCRGEGQVPNWQDWNEYHGEPRPKPCPDCDTKTWAQKMKEKNGEV